MANLNYTMGEAEEYARMRLTDPLLQKLQQQPALFQDSEQRDASIPSQEDAGVARPHRQRPPAAPSYDPRSAPWPEDY